MFIKLHAPLLGYRSLQKIEIHFILQSFIFLILKYIRWSRPCYMLIKALLGRHDSQVKLSFFVLFCFPNNFSILYYLDDAHRRICLAQRQGTTISLSLCNNTYPIPIWKECHLKYSWTLFWVFQDDFLLRHYDKGPCKNKLGHSRASVIWHRTQVRLTDLDHDITRNVITIKLVEISSKCMDGLSQISGFRCFPGSNKNGFEINFECDFSPFTIQSLTRSHPWKYNICGFLSMSFCIRDIHVLVFNRHTLMKVGAKMVLKLVEIS